MALRLAIKPLPHDLEHSVQASNSDTLQSTGQRETMHWVVSVSAGHLKPDALWRMTLLVRVLTPTPQVLEHGVGVLQEVTVQFTAQEPASQGSVVLKLGQSVPP